MPESFEKALTLRMPRVHPKTYISNSYMEQFKQTNTSEKYWGTEPPPNRSATRAGKWKHRLMLSSNATFFECDEAYAIWREIKPKLSETLDGEDAQCFKVALKIFPDKTTKSKETFTNPCPDSDVPNLVKQKA